MGIINRQPPVDPKFFTRGLSPRPTTKPEALMRVQSQGPSTGMPNVSTEGITAGQHVTVEYDGYFPPLPEAQGYGSATIGLHWQTKNAQGDAVPVKDSGWWGYGTRIGFDLPKDVDGPMQVTLTETRADGVVIPDPTVYSADVMPADAPVIKFDENWGNTLNGKLQKGGAFKVAYDVDRLRSQLNLSASQSAQLTVLVSFDGKYPTSKSLVYTDALGEHVDLPEFRIPDDAKNVRMWFVGTPANGRPGDQRYDSDYGRNFSADIE